LEKEEPFWIVNAQGTENERVQRSRDDGVRRNGKCQRQNSGNPRIQGYEECSLQRD
jgi:hypothetical protein